VAVPEAVLGAPAPADTPLVVAVKRPPGWRLAALSLVAGAALGLVATIGLTNASAWARWPLGVVGVVLVLRGADMVSKQVFGPQFEPGFWAAAVWVGLLIVVVALADVLPLQGPKSLPLHSPSYLRPDVFSRHPLGTDGFGRDYVARLIFGGRVSLVIGLGCVVVGGTIGTAVGLAAGYFRGRIEEVVDAITDALLAFPPLVFLLAIVAVLRPSLSTEFISLALLSIPTFVRLAKASTYGVAQREFVLAARGIGARNSRIIVKDILPNIAMPLFSYAMTIVAALMIAEASLSFLGLGIKPPQPSWGNMIAESQTVLQQDPHAILVPAAFLFITVMAFNRLGEAGRRRRLAEFRGL
jgi:peptide/nickel transport system permease protein